MCSFSPYKSMHRVDSIEHQHHSSFIIEDKRKISVDDIHTTSLTETAVHPITAQLPSVIDLRNVSRLTIAPQDRFEANVTVLAKTLNI